jgi:hypothetical protein
MYCLFRSKLLILLLVSYSLSIFIANFKNKFLTWSGQQSHADCIKYHMPIIPQPVKSSALLADRKSLPTWSHREEILNMISQNKVCCFLFYFILFYFHMMHFILNFFFFFFYINKILCRL